MARAILEGTAFEVRWALDAMAQAGLRVGRMWMSGGATRSPTWPGILASATGISLMVTDNPNWPARGAALLAAVGSNMFATIQDAAIHWRVPLKSVEPDTGVRELYDSQYGTYKELVGILSTPVGG
jgi:sugar (pentulose or hexulose) kinase